MEVPAWCPGGRLRDQQAYGNLIDSHTYERANADPPLLRTSFAAVRVTVAEANTEVYVSVDALTTRSRV